MLITAPNFRIDREVLVMKNEKTRYGMYLGLVFIVFSVTACGNDETETNTVLDAQVRAVDGSGSDSTPLSDVGPFQDAAGDSMPSVASDSGSPPAPIADMSAVDSAVIMDTAVLPDAEPVPVDAGRADEFAGRPIGQCTENSQCPEGPNGQSCSRALPGGACTGCGNDAHCPGDTVCALGNCVTECEDETDCPPGLRCLGSGRCAALRCAADVCPIPLFGCSPSGLCQRVSCSEQMDCPAQTTCTAGLCIEDRALAN